MSFTRFGERRKSRQRSAALPPALSIMPAESSRDRNSAPQSLQNVVA
jgi:hypothetical protein